jgi:putative transport protein
VPAPARQLVRDLGILLFVAETGVHAGESPLEGLREALLPTLAAGAVVTLVPVVVALIVGRRLLRLRPVDAWGSACGGMTSSAALYSLRVAADSNEPAISYAAAYAVASVLATLAGQFVILLV